MDRFEDKNRVYYVARYWNGPYGNFAIVAVINPGVDWAAYIGGIASNELYSKTLDKIKDFGAKLTEQDANYYFGSIEELKACRLGYRR